jgi:hypothetical protein
VLRHLLPIYANVIVAQQKRQRRDAALSYGGACEIFRAWPRNEFVNKA